jgi:acetyl esterase
VAGAYQDVEALLLELRGPRRAALHPQVKELLSAAAASGARPMSELTIAEARAQSIAANVLVGPGDVIAEVRDIAIPVGETALAAREYLDDGAAGTIVYFHGGGFVMGDLDKYDPLCRRLARDTECRVVSVAYRLAPEHRFPTPVTDCIGALLSIGEHEQGGPLVVMGDSSGATAAAVAARHARDAGLQVDLQVLAYPITLPDRDTPAWLEHADTGYLRRAASEWMSSLHFSRPEDRRAPDAAPAVADDLSALAPAILVIAEYDPLRDDGLAYACALARARVPVAVDFYPEMSHGFLHMLGYYDRSPEALAKVTGAVRALVAGGDPLADYGRGRGITSSPPWISMT